MGDDKPSVGRLSFRLTVEDHLALLADVQHSSEDGKRLDGWRIFVIFTLGFYGFVVLLGVIQLIKSLLHFGWRTAVVFFVASVQEKVLLIGVALTGPVLLIRWLVSTWPGQSAQVQGVRRNFEEMNPRSHDLCVEISPTGVATQTAYETSFLRWPGIEEITCTSDHVFLYTAPQAAIIVPERAFADQVEFERFVEKANEFRDRALKNEEGPETGIKLEATTGPANESGGSPV
jgi:hypothetical protein